MCNSYQGWSNYPTWAVSLWISNEEGSYNYWNEQAEELIREYQDKPTATGKLADMLKDEIDGNDRPELDGMYNDILQWAFEIVNWYEIAEGITEDMEVESDDDDENENEVDANGNHNMRCDQCEASMINGVYCHELGCPNTHKVKIDDEWITPENDDGYNEEDNND